MRRYCSSHFCARLAYGRGAFSQPAEFARTAPMLLFAASLNAQQRAVLSSVELGAIAASCKIEDIGRATKAFTDAGVIVALSDGGYHVRPCQLLQAVDPTFRLEAALVAAHDEAVAAEGKLRVALEPAIHRASKARHSVWGGAMLFSGLQLAIISRLTYFDLDWDIMEPVSYFLGTGTAIAFYLYMLYFRREHSYTEFDATHLPKWVQRNAPKGFDWDGYNGACTKVDATHKAVEAAKAWSASN
jgi:hypothetical protein